MKTLWPGTIAIIGAGQLGSSLLEGLLWAGASPDTIVVATRDPGHAQALAQRHGVTACSAVDAAERASLLVIAVRPGQVSDLLADLEGHLTDTVTVVSVAAAPDLEQLTAALPRGVPVVRVMPNTAMAVGAGFTGICPAPTCPPEAARRVHDLFAHIGRVLTIDESRIGLVGSLAGHGQAVVYYAADAMVQWGVMHGFSRAEAREIVSASVAGAGTVLTATSAPPAELQHRLTTPGGSTARSMTELDARAVRAAIIDCIDGGRYRDH